MMESFGYMLSALLLAIGLVYMLMGALFESFLTPFVIIFCLPQAMVGALLALLTSGRPMGSSRMIGTIMLMRILAERRKRDPSGGLDMNSRQRTKRAGMTGYLEAGPTMAEAETDDGTSAMAAGMLPTGRWRSARGLRRGSTDGDRGYRRIILSYHARH